MTRFTVKIAADHTQTAHMVEIEAATPWLALEQSHARTRWLSADLYQGRVHLAHAAHSPFGAAGVWQISGPSARRLIAGQSRDLLENDRDPGFDGPGDLVRIPVG